MAAPEKTPELETGKGDSEKASSDGRSAKLSSEKASDDMIPQSSEEGDPGESTTQDSVEKTQPLDEPANEDEEKPSSAFKDLLEYLDITNIEIKQGQANELPAEEYKD